MNRDKIEFAEFMRTLYPSNRTFEYYTNWAKVFLNVDNIRIKLSILNSVIGSDDVENDLRYIIKNYPDVVQAFPILIAEREKNLNILVDYINSPWIYKNFSFTSKKNYSDKEIDLLIEFLKGTKIVELFKNSRITNFIDYISGIEVGMDTNGRKNRSGHISENITETYIRKISEKYNLEYLKEATSEKIERNWNLLVPVDKSSRRYDFTIKVKNKVIIIENNFFSGGGSKLKSVAGEFSGLYDILQHAEDVLAFVWITDGYGWNTAHKPLEEIYNKIDYVFNNKILLDGALEKIIQEETRGK
jgi:DpnII restriction endonuclease.